MYVIETRIKTRSNKTIWMSYKQYRTTNGIENFQKRHQYLFDAGELRVTGNAEPRQSHTKSGKGLLRVEEGALRPVEEGLDRRGLRRGFKGMDHPPRRGTPGGRVDPVRRIPDAPVLRLDNPHRPRPQE